MYATVSGAVKAIIGNKLDLVSLYCLCNPDLHSLPFVVGTLLMTLLDQNTSIQT